jgi:phage head maturation protease
MSDVTGERESLVQGVEYGKREITVIAVPYEEEAVVNDGFGPLREKFARSAFSGIESRAGRVSANRDHNRERAIGLVKSFDSKAERGLVSVVKVSPTPLGDETLQLAADGVLSASISFSARSAHAPVLNGLRTVYKAFLRHLAFTPEPAYEGAAVLDVRNPEEPVSFGDTPNLDLAHAILRDLGRA